VETWEVNALLDALEAAQAENAKWRKLFPGIARAMDDATLDPENELGGR